MQNYRALNLIPPLVKRAKNLARQMAYRTNCSNGTGRLLRLLASQLQSGIIGEIGAGCGVGSAWIINSMASSVTFVAFEKNRALAAVCQTLFEPYAMVRFAHGDWHEIVKFGPFSLLYAPARQILNAAPDVLVEALRSGGIILIDGLVPIDKLPSDVQQASDPLRGFWLNDTRLDATEINVSPTEAVILAARS